jgi:hypothetical protein
MIKKIITKYKLLNKIFSLSKEESNDFILGGKIRHLITHFHDKGEIKKDPTHRKF